MFSPSISRNRVLHAGLEYLSFMVVVGAFFVVAGGIHLRVRGQGRPILNTAFLLGGALLGNVIGTTGASMLLIRPWIARNRSHLTGSHMAFFIFTVSNIGGALLPVGPPLFLGYLKGVPFWWALRTLRECSPSFPGASTAGGTASSRREKRNATFFPSDFSPKTIKPLLGSTTTRAVTLSIRSIPRRLDRACLPPSAPSDTRIASNQTVDISGATSEKFTPLTGLTFSSHLES